MQEFMIEFEITVKGEYLSTVEAETKDEAIRKLQKDPFDDANIHLLRGPSNQRFIKLNILNIKKV